MTCRIAIVGGGIGGLFLALVLKKLASSPKLTVDVYEAESAFAEVSAGITLWQRTRSIFSSFGLGGALDNRIISPPLILRKSDTKKPLTFHTFDIPHGSITLPRGDMIQLLVDNLELDATSRVHVHFSKRLQTYQQDASGVTLHFDDGSSSRADILVGADGIGSPTRKTMYSSIAERLSQDDHQDAESFAQRFQLTWTGTYAYRALLEREKLAAISPGSTMLKGGFMWCGSGKHVVSYPISPNLINLLFFDTVPGGLGKVLTGSQATRASKDEIVDLYEGWEDDLCIAAQNIGHVTKWAISHVRDLPQYADGRVVLLGDSAHAMSTHFGAGAGQAIEDAYILGRILAHPKVATKNVGEALKVYDAVRRPIAAGMVERSLRAGFLYEFHPDYLPAGIDTAQLCAGDRGELQKLADELQEMVSAHWTEMPEADWERARGMLEDRL